MTDLSAWPPRDRRVTSFGDPAAAAATLRGLAQQIDALFGNHPLHELGIAPYLDGATADLRGAADLLQSGAGWIGEDRALVEAAAGHYRAALAQLEVARGRRPKPAELAALELRAADIALRLAAEAIVARLTRTPTMPRPSAKPRPDPEVWTS